MNAQNKSRISEQLNLQMGELEKALGAAISDPTSWIAVANAAIEKFRKGLKEGLVSQVARGLDVDLADLLAKGAGIACVNGQLYAALAASLKQKAGGQPLSQVHSFKLVDIWGRNLSSRALVLQLVTEVAEGHASMTRDKLKASLQVLFEGLQHDFDAAIIEVGKLESFGRFAALADALGGHLKSAQAAGLDSAILKEIEQLGV